MCVCPLGSSLRSSKFEVNSRNLERFGSCKRGTLKNSGNIWITLTSSRFVAPPPSANRRNSMTRVRKPYVSVSFFLFFCFLPFQLRFEKRKKTAGPKPTGISCVFRNAAEFAFPAILPLSFCAYYPFPFLLLVVDQSVLFAAALPVSR